MPLAIEEAMTMFAGIGFMILMSPLTWLVVAGFAFKGKPLVHLIPSGILAQFISVLCWVLYARPRVSDVFTLDAILNMIFIAIAVGSIVALLVFYLLKICKSHRFRSVSD